MKQQYIFIKCLMMSFLLIFTLTAQAKTDKKQMPTNLHINFVQTSTEAVLNKTNDDNVYQLTLYHVSPYITYFTHRPGRDSGLAEMDDFVKAWSVGGDASFAHDNPNGVLFAGSIDDQTNSSSTAYVVQIANPRYDARRSTATYDISPLNNKVSILSHMTLGQVVLVIN